MTKREWQRAMRDAFERRDWSALDSLVGVPGDSDYQAWWDEIEEQIPADALAEHGRVMRVEFGLLVNRRAEAKA